MSDENITYLADRRPAENAFGCYLAQRLLEAAKGYHHDSGTWDFTGISLEDLKAIEEDIKHWLPDEIV